MSNTSEKPKDTIKRLYGQLTDKVGFIESLAESTGRSPLTLQQHWFTRFFNVPSEFQDETIKKLNEAVNEQTAKTA